MTGPAGDEAEHRLADFARYSVFLGQVLTDEAHLRRIMARHNPGRQGCGGQRDESELLAQRAARMGSLAVAAL
ncbi:hypothetical protein AQJ43_31790 [Streptomyces avermitilis]|uniref:Uncharacterized protein n=1 Tax=Streptomyces avermitilis TaxID=33903 RepID=A0A4D4MBS9_STRAX|nr:MULTISPECIES: hypothetical protein [Streptomyces]KUN50630.1 hypothetical protein AQJ43_31790 [Streptomyces avermitilis]MYS96352.1 hypothetical protein [Streptomyces sp. SID5469]OOV21772.1 hypothetical protein SM007_32935 [Streptomyces avermitilis]BBJ48244.1 hypothetical protein SAVMC3_08730 [Streptomyces avermitilis]GDY69390.1 hypothetical protein SAV14893_087830 [Streptomyces avermitilis]